MDSTEIRKAYNETDAQASEHEMWAGVAGYIPELCDEVDRLRGVVAALLDGYSAHLSYFYDEEGVPGWVWRNEHGVRVGAVLGEEISLPTELAQFRV